MPSGTARLLGVHARLVFPPPATRPWVPVLKQLADLDEGVAWALFVVLRRARNAGEFSPSVSGRWKHAEDICAAAALAPEIGPQLVQIGAPVSLRDVSRAEVARACHRLYKWAGRRGYVEVALQFAEAAALLQPKNAGRAFEAARTHRVFGDPGTASIFYSRAICASRRPAEPTGAGGRNKRTASRRRWHVYIRAHLGMGRLWETSGDRKRAAAHYATAADAAESQTGEKWLAAATQHDLLGMKAEMGNFSAAYDHARKAYALMPKHDARFPALAHDFAMLLVEMKAYALALPLLEMIVQKPIPDVERVLGWSTLGRAAGALGRLEQFRESERLVGTQVDQFDTHAAAAHYNLGMGALALRLHADAERHALRSIELANTRGPRGVLALAEPLLAEVTAQGQVPAPVDDPPRHLRRLAKDMALRLAQWQGPRTELQSLPTSVRVGDL
jgi:tetratricopeptide (TPR) repeat protein